MKRFPARTLALIFAGGALLVLGFAIGHFAFPKLPVLTSKELHTQDGSAFKYVSPLLECGDIENITPRELRATEEEVRTYIDVEKQKGTLSSAGVYYRDLNNGSWFSIDADKEFSPGSLLKVPLLMSVLAESKTNPSILTQKVTYAGGGSNAKQDIPAANPIQVGHDYTVEELLQHMIEQSDNNAALLLYQILGYEKTASAYQDMGIDAPQVDKDYLISVRGYSTFFRILFNSTYISPELSERGLTLLTKSDFTTGIVAGVPTGISVAHKFGERHFEGQGAVEQLHDCGIVYAAQKPYIMCIMTQGRSVAELAPIIANVSRIVYGHVSK